MKVTLKRYTPDALELLVGTKTTRMRGKSPEEMTEDELYDHFQYMLDTIRSPFEFVDYIFHIEGVSKNFTHQLVRTRTGAYQQETSRALEVDVHQTISPFDWDESQDMMAKDNELFRIWEDAIGGIEASYKELIAAGAELQDARGILPTNMPTTIDAKFNLRTMSDMGKTRLCARTQGEYQQVYRLMREEVLKIHPWAEPLLQVNCIATGQCAFPRWGGKVIEPAVWDGAPPSPVKDAVYQCKFYRPWMDQTANRDALRKVFWVTEIQQANPVAKDGKSM